MAQDTFAAPCGCIWHGDAPRHRCAAWQDLAERRDRLHAHPNADRELRRIEEQMNDHMPPWMIGG